MMRALTSEDRPGQLVTAAELGATRLMRIGKFPGNTPYDHELARIAANFLIAGDRQRQWDEAQRPLPANVTLVTRATLAQADVIIVDIDQWTFTEPDRTRLFYQALEIDRPKILINHGCNTVDGCSGREMRALVGNLPVVCQSAAAQTRWKHTDSTVIIPAIGAQGWPQTDYSKANIVVTQCATGPYALYRNDEAVEVFEALSGTRVDWIGPRIAPRSLEAYRALLSRSAIHFNPSFAEPNPRGRTEAMLCGLVPVTTDKHGESEYIENGVNGFCSNDMDELFDCLAWLVSNPEECERLGKAARQTARRHFATRRFVSAWREILNRVTGESIAA
jgi:hypothetical protein